MTIIVNTKELAGAAKAAAAMSNIRYTQCEWSVLHLEGGDLHITGTDSQTWITRRVSTQGELEPVGVGAHMLGRITASLEGDETQLELDKNRLTITSGAHSTKLSVISDVNRAMASRTPAGVITTQEWSAEDVRCIQAVADFCSTNETQAKLIGLNFAAGRAMATDSYHAAIVNVPWTDERATLVLPDALKGLDGPVEVGRTDIDMRFSTANASIITRLIDQEFPTTHFLNATPQMTEAACVIGVGDTAVWLRALKRMAAHHDGDVNAVYVELVVEDDQVQLVVPQVASEILPIESVMGKDIKNGFNAKYLSDMLALSSSCTIGLLEGMKPTRFDSGVFHGVLMPLRKQV